MVLRLERDAWSMVKWLSQATEEYTPHPQPHPPTPRASPFPAWFSLLWLLFVWYWMALPGWELSSRLGLFGWRERGAGAAAGWLVYRVAGWSVDRSRSVGWLV